MLLASCAVASVRRLGGGAFLSGCAALLGLLWYVSFIFRAPLTAWTIPTPSALLEVWGALAQAYSHSLVDYAPVPLREGYAVMIVGATWIATTAAELTTFRWKRPLLAVAVPLMMFSFAMLVGTGESSPILVVLFLAALFAFWASESGHRLRSWGRWIDLDASSGALARRLGASCLAAAFVAPLFLPAIGDGMVSWRTGSGEGRSGEASGTGATLSPWVSIVPRLITQSDEEMFRVQADEPAYWRTTSLEIFDGLGWREQKIGRLPASEGAILGERDVPAPDAERATLVQELTVTGLRGEALPAAATPTRAFRMTDAGADPQRLHYDPQSGAVQVSGGLEENEIYRIASEVPRASFEDLDEASPPAGRGFELSAEGGLIRRSRTFHSRPGSPNEIRVPDVYYQLPSLLAPEVVQLTTRWTRNEDTPLKKLVEIQQRLRSFDYTLNPDQAQDHDYLRRFLLETRAGYCQQFATAFAVMARILDYPARVSVGFLSGSQDLATGAFTAKGTDAHAWPEVYFAGYGWIPFEPTPRDAYAAPAHTQPSPESPGGTAGPGPNQQAEGIAGGPLRDVVLGREGVTWDGRPLPPVLAQSADTVNRAWEGYFRALAATLALALTVLLLATPLVKETRDRRRYTRTRDERVRTEVSFIELQRHARELADERRPHESARTYLRRLGEAEGVDPLLTARLAELYESAAYSADGQVAGMAQEARRIVKKLRSQLWAGASWWSRGLHLFSPGALRMSGREVRQA